jgi:DNA-binding response OmpR family regulator
MKLLIVEDEVRISNSLKKGFSEEGFDVETALDGEEGLNKSLHGQYDVVILDLMLPKINGITILKKMRERKIYTPVIILTAKGSVEERVEGLDIGADDYLPKPFSFDELLARVNALIRRSQRGETVLTIDSLELDPFKKSVKRSDTPVDLSNREFKILEYLMTHKGAILSEQQIINHVWDYDADVFSNVVAAHIKNLRNKIDKKFAKDKQLIKTVRGMGYKIDG